MTRDLDRAIAGLKRHRKSAERSVAQFHENGSHQDAEQLRIDFARMEKIFERMIMAAVDAEGGAGSTRPVIAHTQFKRNKRCE